MQETGPYATKYGEYLTYLEVKKGCLSIKAKEGNLKKKKKYRIDHVKIKHHCDRKIK